MLTYNDFIMPSYNFLYAVVSIYLRIGSVDKDLLNAVKSELQLTRER